MAVMMTMLVDILKPLTKCIVAADDDGSDDDNAGRYFEAID